MFPKNDKRRLYQLMDMFLSNKITAQAFCDEFYHSYDLEIDYATLNEREYSAFSMLNKVSSRFSQFKEDQLKYPGTFSSEEELRNKVIETKRILEE